MFCIGWFGRTFSLFAKLGCFIDDKNLFSFQSSATPGAADLFTKSMPGHFLILFSSNPSKPTKTLLLYALATISMFSGETLQGDGLLKQNNGLKLYFNIFLLVITAPGNGAESLQRIFPHSFHFPINWIQAPDFFTYSHTKKRNGFATSDKF